MDNIETLRRLSHFNEWWVSGKVPERLVKPFKRRDFFKIRELLTKEKITILIGPRRVGKTTLMRQVADDLITQGGIDPRRIMYVKMDDFLLKASTESRFEALLDVYSQNILKLPFEKIQETVFLFLDEIHKWDNWQQQIKDVFDQNYNLIFAVSGSSAPAIFRGGATALTGRYREQIMLPMKFVDIVNMKFGKHGYEKTRFDDISLAMRKSLKEAVIAGNCESFFKQLQSAFASLAAQEKEIEIVFREYLIKGGYPELYGKADTDWEECSEILKNQLQAVLTKDILEVFKIRNPEVIMDLFQLIGSQTAQIRKYSDMCEKLKITKTDTLKEYLQYLKETYMIGIAELFSHNVDTSKKSNKKIYVMDVGMRNIALGLLHPSLLENPTDLGKIAETVVYDHCRRLKFNLEPGIANKPLYYWRKNGHEVDVIIPTTKYPLPIEVKYREKPSRKSIEAFMGKYKSPFGIEVTKNVLDKRDSVIYVPIWLFLLMC